MPKALERVGPRITDHGLTLTTANGSQITLDEVFMIDFHIAGRDVKILVAVCSYISSPTIIGINLMRQEKLVFDIATDQVIFGSAKGAHNGWKQAQVTINVAVTINALETRLVA
jgi:hypothetical protein